MVQNRPRENNNVLNPLGAPPEKLYKNKPRENNNILNPGGAPDSNDGFG